MADLHRHGYEIAELVLSDRACARIAAELPEVNRGGVRNLIGHPAVAAMVRDARFSRLLGGRLIAVKATLFDKTPATNWRVQWHQDRMIAVKERIELEGYGPWAVKDGVLHVEPPAPVLAEMLAVRVHLDESGPDNGPLRVIPGSHRRGKLAADEIARVAAAGPVAQLTVPRGALLLMRPLLVHASSPAANAGHRRVLHIELAPRELIAPLRWHSHIEP